MVDAVFERFQLAGQLPTHHRTNCPRALLGKLQFDHKALSLLFYHTVSGVAIWHP
jgi:hypothetical protein